MTARLAKAGEKSEAEEIRALMKPTRSAWLVNQLYRRNRKAFDRLLDTGANMRAIQHGGGDAGELRVATSRRRKQVANLLDSASRFPETLAPAMCRRVKSTLEAIATFGDAGPDQTLGRLTEDVDPPGFEALFLSVGTSAPKKRARKLPAPTVDPRRIARARVQVDKMRVEFDRKRLESERLARQRAVAEERFVETTELVRAAERGLQLARGRLPNSGKDLERAVREAERADAVLHRSRKKLDDARAALRKASKPR